MGAICTSCGTEFDVYLSACPRCGSGDRNVFVSETIRVKDSLDRSSIREFYITNHKLKWFTIGFSLISILLGLILNSWVAFLIGLILWVPTYFLGRKAETKVIEQDHFRIE